MHSQCQRCSLITQFDYEVYSSFNLSDVRTLSSSCQDSGFRASEDTKQGFLVSKNTLSSQVINSIRTTLLQQVHQQPHLLKVRMQNSLAACQGNSSNFTLQTLVSFCDMAAAKRTDHEPSRVRKKTQIHTNPAIVHSIIRLACSEF